MTDIVVVISINKFAYIIVLSLVFNLYFSQKMFFFCFWNCKSVDTSIKKKAVQLVLTNIDQLTYFLLCL